MPVEPKGGCLLGTPLSCVLPERITLGISEGIGNPFQYPPAGSVAILPALRYAGFNTAGV